MAKWHRKEISEHHWLLKNASEGIMSAHVTIILLKMPKLKSFGEVVVKMDTIFSFDELVNDYQQLQKV